MPADAAVADALLETDGTGGPPHKKGAKKLVLFVVLPIVLLIGGLAGLTFTGIFDPLGLSDHAEAEVEGEGHKKPAPDPATLVFFDLPDLLVNLNSSGKRASYLKMRVSLELGSEEDAAKLQKLSPRIIDSFQMYLRELRLEDLRGSAGLARLREELIRRVNASVEPLVIRDVLFREMLVQ